MKKPYGPKSQTIRRSVLYCPPVPADSAVRVQSMTFRVIIETPQSYNNNANYNDDALKGEAHHKKPRNNRSKATLPYNIRDVNAHSVRFFSRQRFFSVQNGKEMQRVSCLYVWALLGTAARYPSPRTVWMRMSSTFRSFRRRSFTWVSTVRGSDSES